MPMRYKLFLRLPRILDSAYSTALVRQVHGIRKTFTIPIPRQSMLRSVPGVADVNALGGTVKTYEVVPDNARMYSRGIRFAELREALEQNNRNDGAGRLNDGEEVLLVRTEGSIRSLEDVRAIVVRPDLREPVRVADLAHVQTGALTRYGAVTRNGSGEAVQGMDELQRDLRTQVEGVQLGAECTTGWCRRWHQDT